MPSRNYPSAQRLIIEFDLKSFDIMPDGEFRPEGTVKRSVSIGDTVLVDPTAYFQPDEDEWTEIAACHAHGLLRGVWARVTGLSGGASAYPIKVEFLRADNKFKPGGQYKASELLEIHNREEGGAP